MLSKKQMVLELSPAPDDTPGDPRISETIKHRILIVPTTCYAEIMV